MTEESGDGVSQVCTACGVVVDTAALITVAATGPDTGSSYVANTVSLALRHGGRNGPELRSVLTENQLGNRRQCYEWLKRAATQFGMDSVMLERAVNLFNKKVSRQLLSRQLAIAAACCYQVLRENGRSVSLPTLAKSSQCTGKELHKALRTITKGASDGMAPMRLQDLLPEAVQSLDPGERPQVMARATALLGPLHRCWFLEGRPPRCLVPSLVFTAWKSLDVARTYTTYRAFCKQHGMAPIETVLGTVRTLNNVLLRLAKQLPWLKDTEVKVSMVTAYVDDILRYSASLALDATNEVRGTAQGELTPVERSAAIFHTFRKPPRKQWPGPSDSTVADCNGDGHISDSEINGYIRNEEEVRAVQRIIESKSK